MPNVTLMTGIISMVVGIGIIAYFAGDVKEILGLKKERRAGHRLQRLGINIDVKSILFYVFFVLILLVSMFVMWYLLKI